MVEFVREPKASGLRQPLAAHTVPASKATFLANDAQRCLELNRNVRRVSGGSADASHARHRQGSLAAGQPLFMAHIVARKGSKQPQLEHVCKLSLLQSCARRGRGMCGSQCHQHCNRE
eukprot:scaffold233477_cov18-Tisochrysis_lutea.AAC.1